MLSESQKAFRRASSSSSFFYKFKMEFALGIASVGFLWEFCSINCVQRRLQELLEKREDSGRETVNSESIEKIFEIKEPFDDRLNQNLHPPPERSSAAAPRCELGRRGKVTKNPFFNYLREQRACHCKQPQQELVRNAAERWNKMNLDQKRTFKRDQVSRTHKRHDWVNSNSIATLKTPQIDSK